MSNFADDPRTVIDVFSDPVVVVDDRFVITSANQALANLLGVGHPDALVGRLGLDWVHEPDRIDASERLTGLMTREPTAPVSLRVAREDGSLVWVEVTGAVLPVPGSSDRFVLGVRNVDWRHEADLDAARVVLRSQALVSIALVLQSAPPSSLRTMLDEVVATIGHAVGASVVSVHEVENDGSSIRRRARWTATPGPGDDPGPVLVSLDQVPNWVNGLNSSRGMSVADPAHRSVEAELARIEPMIGAGHSLALAPADRLVGSLTVAVPPESELSGDEMDFLVRSAQLLGVALLRARNQQALIDSEAMFRDLFERSSAIMYLVDPVTLRLVDANEAAARFYGHARADMAGMDLHELTVHTAEELRGIVERVRAEGTTIIDERQRLASGEIRAVEIHSTPMRQGNRVLDLAIVQDVTEQRSAVERLERLASTDDLTGAFNRRRFLRMVADEVDRCERYSRPMTLLMLDLDHFKSINDRYGHRAGDAALVAFTEQCTAHLRASDRFARLGGEEFGILLPEAPLADAAALAERIRESVEKMPVPEIPGPPPCTVSIGGAEWKPGWSVDTLFAAADRMLYRAKRGGRNRFEG